MRFISLSNPTVVLALVLGILMAYLILFELPGKNSRKAQEENATRLLDFELSDIQNLTIRHTQEEIYIEKTADDNWVMTRPIQSEVDPQEMRGFLESLLNVHFSRLVVETGGDPAEFGVVHPNLEVVIGLSEKTERIRIGDDAPVGNLVFLARESDGRVVTVEKWIQGSLTRTVFDFRRKKILQFNEDKVEGILLSFPGQEISLEKTGEDWFIQKPFKDTVDPDSISKLLTLLKVLRADSFIDPGRDFDQTIKGLVTPGAKVTLREGASETSVRFFKSSERERAYVLTETGSPLYLVPQARMNDIQPDLFHYQDKNLVRFDVSPVQRISVSGPQEKYILLRSGGIWSVEGMEGTVQQNLAERLLTQLGNLRAFESAEKGSGNQAANGLVSPTYLIRLYSGEPDPVATLKIGNEWKGMLFTRGRDALGIVMINRDFLDEIPTLDELVKKIQETPTAEDLKNLPGKPAD